MIRRIKSSAQPQARFNSILLFLCFAMLAITKRCYAFSFRAAKLAINSAPRGPHSLTSPMRRFSHALKAVNSKTVKPRSLVVHGPPDFSITSKKSKTDRPFKLVIVESPSKCKTIFNILQDYVKAENMEFDFVVTSCMGHIRNIPQQKQHKDQLVAGIDIENGYKPTYTILPEKEKLVMDLTDLTQRAQQLILATDDDREGEAMAWHLVQVLLDGNLEGNAKQQPPQRVRFTEITQKAILESIQNPETALRNNLVNAQETRRILDRLAGFTVSPVLWKKIAPGLSAGRVQSVGMALIVQRERERLLFQESEYWDLQADFAISNQHFEGQLVEVDGQQLASSGSDFEAREANTLTASSSHKLHLLDKDAKKLEHDLRQAGWSWKIDDIKATKRKLSPPTPFITSTLQQEANTKLGLSVSRTMQTAQQLYENGFISYMRTDSNHLSDDAKIAIETEITTEFGLSFFDPTSYKEKKSKKKKKKSSSNNEKPDPQAAHEAIRPAIQSSGRFTQPSDLPQNLDGAAKELYELIYQRTVASHMPPQVSNQTSIKILGENDGQSVLFRSSSSVVIKPGFSALYSRSKKEQSELPVLREGDSIDCTYTTALMHMTQPPSRYTEASFVQELEARGVGRPSTYAGTVQILRDRAYVGSPTKSGSSNYRGTGKAVVGSAISAQRAAGGEEFVGSRSARAPMVPSLTAFVVTSLFEKHCNMYVDPSFTARMEDRLDKIANSEGDVSEDERISYLDEFFQGSEGLASKVKNIAETVDADDARRASLPSLENTDSSGPKIGLFVGPWGPYVKKLAAETTESKVPTANLPAGMAADLSTITLQSLSSILATKEENGLILGQHPSDNRNIRLRTGRFGAFLQWGEDGDENTTTHTLPVHIRNMKNIDVDHNGSGGSSLNDMLGLTFDEAVQYVNLPREVCTLEELPIVAAIGPYGPYLKYNNTFMTLNQKDGDVLTIEPETAQSLVTEGIVNQKTKLGAGVIAVLGEMAGSQVTVKSGRFGPYINWRKVNAKLPTEYREDPSELPFDEAWELIEEKEANDPKKGSSKGKSSILLPPAPKRPLSAYLYFSKGKRPEVAQQFKSLGDISKELARLWAETSEKDRESYIKLAAEDKASYEEAKRKWTLECQTILSKSGASGIGSKVKGLKSSGPKRALSAYMYFCKDKRPDVARRFKSLGDVSKELARLWSLTSDGDKKPYEELAAKDKERYEKEKIELGISKPATAKARKKSKSKSKKAVGKPKKKRGPTAYILFCSEHRADIVDDDGNKLPLGETTKRLAQMWKDCDKDIREKFVKEAEKQKLAL